MNQKRDLLRELTGCPDNSEAPFVLNSECILELVLNQSGSASERRKEIENEKITKMENNSGSNRCSDDPHSGSICGEQKDYQRIQLRAVYFQPDLPDVAE